MHLLTSIYSYMQSGKLYGKAGEEIQVIAIHDQIAVVERCEDGFRFPCPVAALSESPVEPEAVIVELIEHTPSPRRTTAKAIKTATSQPTLF